MTRRPSRSAEEYWKWYSACPKRAAFKDGRVIAFCASEDNEFAEWWDLTDASHDEYIPVSVQVEAFDYDLVDEHAEPVSGPVDLQTEMTMDGSLPTGDDLSDRAEFTRGNKEDGTYERWDHKGWLQVRETRVNGVLEGERVEFDEYANRFVVEHYRDGALNGVRERRTPYDWRLTARATYKDDLHIGVSEVWYKDGSLAKRFIYDENGRFHGDQETFERDGTRTSLKQYLHGKEHGLSANWNGAGYKKSPGRGFFWGWGWGQERVVPVEALPTSLA